MISCAGQHSGVGGPGSQLSGTGAGQFPSAGGQGGAGQLPGKQKKKKLFKIRYFNYRELQKDAFWFNILLSNCAQ